MRKTLLAVLIPSFLVSGCVAVDEPPQSINPSTSVESDLDIKPSEAGDEETSEKAEPEILEPNWTQTASPVDVTECKIPDPRPLSEQLIYRGQRINGVLGRDPVGFTDWRRDGLLPIEGEVNIIFARVAFADAPPSATVPDGYLEEQAQKVTDLGHHWSQGMFTYEFQIVDEWVEVPANHADYPVSAGNDVDHSPDAYALAEENIEIVSKLIIENLPSDLDFEAADIFVPVWSTNITEFTMPVTWRGGGLRGPDGQRTDLLFMGNSTYMHDALDYTWSVIAHDFLHLQGLNEHAPGGEFATHIGSMTRPSQRGWSAVMNAWETFLLDWFEEGQVHCIVPDTLEQTEQVLLTPLEKFGGERKTIVIPIEDYKALVVESRRPSGYSATWPAENSGLLVYEVDSDADHLDHGPNGCSNSRENNPKWAYYILPDGVNKGSTCNDPTPYFLRTGDKLTYAGIQIELVYSGDEVDYVSVSKVGQESLEPSGSANGHDPDSGHSFQPVSVISRKTSVNNHCSCCGCIGLLGG